MKNNLFKTAIYLSITGCTFLACTNNSKQYSTSTDSITSDSSNIISLKPAGPAPEWGKTIRPEMQTVMEKLASYGDRPIEGLSATEARKNHTPTDAVLAVAEQNHIVAPTSKVDTSGKDISVNGGNVHVRIYKPKNAKSAVPIVVYYHGGGFVIANLDVYDASARALSEQVNAIVVSVAYRLAPEYKFPTAHQDAFAAYEWVVKNAVSLKGDPAKIAVAGESAGGNLAANVSIMARDKHIMLPVAQVLIYPIAQADMNTESYKMYTDAKPLNKAMMNWFTTQYLYTAIEAQDPKISLIHANLRNLPPTTIITAEIDPLNNDGVMLSNKLSEAGVKVNSRNYEGVTHEFFGMALVVPEAKLAQAYAAEQLKAAFK